MSRMHQSPNSPLRSERPATRRTFLLVGASALMANGWLARALAAAGADTMVSIENFSAAGKSLGVVQVAKVIKTDAQWRAQLSSLSYQITRQAGTEYAFSGKNWNNHAGGLYRCICCDTALYDSKTKFESGTGWPSFWQPISALNILKSADSSLGMSRDAISCKRCDAHLGHVFDDGPKPTGLRYCMNSEAMRFVAYA